MKRTAIAAIVAVISAATPVLAVEFAGTATVVDGDTIDVGGTRLRLFGIDAPESGQRCVGEGKQIIRPGDAATERLEALIKDGVRCTASEKDQYDRPIATCFTMGGQNINQTLVREGHAWAFVKFAGDYLPDQQAAHDEQLGVWKLACEAPWDFRAKRWEVAVQKSPDGCPIKGNISENGRIYHLPWDRFYIRTKIDAAKGERWFCDEGLAVKAGWRRAKQ